MGVTERNSFSLLKKTERNSFSPGKIVSRIRLLRLGAVSVSLVFGLVRGAGVFAAVIPSFVLVSRMPFVKHNRDFGHFFRAASSSRREAMVGGALTRDSAFRFGLGVSGATIVSGSCACPSHLWISHVLTSSSVVRYF